MSREFNYLVRIHGTNLDGTKKIAYALCGMKGVGKRLAHTAVKALGLDPDIWLGTLSDPDVESQGRGGEPLELAAGHLAEASYGCEELDVCGCELVWAALLSMIHDVSSAGEDGFLDLLIDPLERFAFNPEADTDLNQGI